MCCVMPPASPAATCVSRIASSSEVLPWSTWPMIVTTGGRSTSTSGSSSKVGSAATSSAALTISTSLSNSVASTWMASSDRVCVSVAISPRPMSFLMISDRVEQRGLAVVDVAHDRHDRRAVDEHVGVVLEGGLRGDVLGGADDLDLLVELGRQHLDGVVRQGLRERGHLAQAHELLDDLGSRRAARSCRGRRGP